MKIKTSRGDDFAKYITEHKLTYQRENHSFVVHVTTIEDVLEITSLFRESIEDIEINKGTLNEVFIAITGKEIRE